MLLVLLATCIDALGVRRGLKPEYFILTDPLIILAGALLLEKMSDLRFSKWAYPSACADRCSRRHQPGRAGQTCPEAQRP